MRETEARNWLAANLDVSRETSHSLARYVDLLVAATSTQNLIGASTIPNIWDRHIIDSAQLLLHAPASGHWLDIGSGGGLPGIVIAIVSRRPVTLVESRSLRAGFLRQVVEALRLTDVNVVAAPVAAVRTRPPAVLSARAVAPLGRLFAAGIHLADKDTCWLLPKGQRAASELAAACESWQGEFTMKPSVTDPKAAIIVAQNVKRRDGT